MLYHTFRILYKNQNFMFKTNTEIEDKIGAPNPLSKQWEETIEMWKFTSGGEECQHSHPHSLAWPLSWVLEPYTPLLAGLLPLGTHRHLTITMVPPLPWEPAPLPVFCISVMTPPAIQLPRPETYKSSRVMIFFHQRPNMKYLKVCRPYSLSQLINSAVTGRKQP